MPIKTEEFVEPKSGPFPWVWLGVVYLALTFLVVTVNRWEFPYGLLYSLGFFSVAIVLASKESGYLAGLMAAILPVFAVFVSLGGFDAAGGMWIGVICFFLLLANEFEVVEWKAKTVAVKYLVLVPFIVWLVWAITYFINHGFSLPLATILNHGGIAVLSLDSVLLLIGVYGKREIDIQENKYHIGLKWIGFFGAVLGALWLTLGLGWGLQLVH